MLSRCLCRPSRAKQLDRDPLRRRERRPELDEHAHRQHGRGPDRKAGLRRLRRVGLVPVRPGRPAVARALAHHFPLGMYMYFV